MHSTTLWAARRPRFPTAPTLATRICGTCNSVPLGATVPLYLTERQVLALMETDPMLHGAVDALEQAFLASARGEIATPKEERLRVVWPPNQDWRPYEKD